MITDPPPTGFTGMKIFPQRMTDLINESISDGAVSRTASASPGLLIMANYIELTAN